MKGYFKIGDKIGYLDLKTGKYKYAYIVGMDGENQLQMQSKHGRHINNYTEKISDICRFLKTPSIDFKDGRMLLKHISVK